MVDKYIVKKVHISYVFSSIEYSYLPGMCIRQKDLQHWCQPIIPLHIDLLVIATTGCKSYVHGGSDSALSRRTIANRVRPERQGEHIMDVLQRVLHPPITEGGTEE